MNRVWVKAAILTAVLAAAVAAFGWDYSQRIRTESRITAVDERSQYNKESIKATTEHIDERFDKLEKKIDHLSDRIDKHMEDSK